jgi:serine/threonine-protein kinase
MANSPARAAVDVGSVIAGTYKIEALLGRGGMGAVFLASHQRLAGKQVAIKILHTEIEDAEIVARFKREAEIAARLNHPNIVGVIDYNVAPDGTPYLVLDYLEGETLAQRIARGPLSLDQVVSIVRQVGSALAAAHRAGIVHRDLKPQNIFLVPTEVDGRIVEIAKVLDFGISKIRGSQTVKTQDSALLGTPQYMAPEQAMGQHASVDERTDVFAFGAIVYEMLSGQPAFGGASIPEVVFKVVYEQPLPLDEQAPAAPPAIVTAVAQAMAKPLDQRFANVTAFVEAVTGQPLTLTRGAAPAPPSTGDSPSAARRVSTGEAFARTMGSADHGDSPLASHAAAVDATLASPSSSASSGAPPLARPALAAVPVAPTATGHAAERATPLRRRATGAIVGIVLIAAAAIGGVMFFATRDRAAAPAAPRAAPHREAKLPKAPVSDSPAPVRPIQPATEQPTADQKLSEVAQQQPVPTATVPDPKDAKRSASKGRTERTTGKPVQHTAAPPSDTETETDGDDDARDKLKRATAALDARDYDLAERLANAVINSAAPPRQRAVARLIHGTVQCAARNDQEAAQIDLRNLDGFRAMRTRLLTVCRSHGILTAQ